MNVAAAVAEAELASFVSCNPGVRSSKCSLSSYSGPPSVAAL